MAQFRLMLVAAQGGSYRQLRKATELIEMARCQGKLDVYDFLLGEAPTNNLLAHYQLGLDTPEGAEGDYDAMEFDKPDWGNA
jgi:hypothetical protein